MKRRITIEVDQDLADYLNNPWAASNTAVGLVMGSRLIRAARAALGTQPEPCPTCEGQGCERCFTTGRRHLTKLYVHPTTTGRATLALWQGAPGTMQPVAETATDRDVADVTIDAMLACLRDGGLVVDDRRAR